MVVADFGASAAQTAAPAAATQSMAEPKNNFFIASPF
jgi:hypothetical protein